VDEDGSVTASEECIRTDARRFRIVSIIAGVVCAPFVVGHAAFALFVIPIFGQMYADMGGKLPAFTKLLVDLSHFGLLAALLVAVDVAVFVLMYVLAKRYWIGLLFVPALYLPMYNVISLTR